MNNLPGADTCQATHARVREDIPTGEAPPRRRGGRHLPAAALPTDQVVFAKGAFRPASATSWKAEVGVEAMKRGLAAATAPSKRRLKKQSPT